MENITKLSGPVELLKAAVRRLRDRWRPVVAVWAIAYGFSLFSYYVFPEIDSVAVLVVVSLAGMAVYLWASAATLVAVNDRNLALDLSAVSKAGLALIPALLWIQVLTGLITFAGFLLLIVPGIIFGVWYAFSGFVLVDEGVRGWPALKQSREYVRNYWWPVAGRMAFLLLIYIPFIIVFYLFAPEHAAGSPEVNQQGNPFFSAMQTILTVFVLTYNYFLYKELKRTKAIVPQA